MFHILETNFSMLPKRDEIFVDKICLNYALQLLS